MPTTVCRTEHAGPAALAARLAGARKGLGLSLREAVRDIEGLSPSTLCRIETGERAPLPGPALQVLADRLRVPRDELAQLAGGLTPEGIDQILSSDTRHAIRAGQLTGAAHVALRHVHLAQIALAQGGGTLRDLGDVLDLGFRPDDPAGFDSPAVYRTPRGVDPATERSWMAHGLAHVALARESGTVPECTSSDADHPLERDVTFLARHLLVPTAKLKGAFRDLWSPDPRTVQELSDLVELLVTKFLAPASWIAARLADEGLIGRTAA